MQKIILNCDMTTSEHITQQITNLREWQGKTFATLRQFILEAEPDIVEEWKWGTAVWSKGGSICSVVPYKNHVKLEFFHGGLLDDPNNLLNDGQEGSVSRGIIFRKSAIIDRPALQDLIREAITYNLLGDLSAQRKKASPLITLGVIQPLAS